MSTITAQSSSAAPKIRNWNELRDDITAKILVKLSVIDILTSVQKVCLSWRRVSKDPSIWRRIELIDSVHLRNRGVDLENMCRHAIDRSGGQLIDFSIEFFGSHDLLHYITERASGLKRIRLVGCFRIKDEGFIKAAAKLPLLEEVEITHCLLTKKAIEAVGKSCPLLNSFKFNTLIASYPDEPGYDEAYAIAHNMPGLRHLQIVGNKLTDDCLKSILRGCPQLESLDLRLCGFLFYLSDVMKKTCADQVKSLRFPNDSIEDFPLFARHAQRAKKLRGEEDDYFNADL